MSDDEAARERAVMDKAIQKAIATMGPSYEKLTPEEQASLRTTFEDLFRQFLIHMQDLGNSYHRIAVDGVLKILEIAKVPLNPFVVKAIQDFRELD
jgi:hypothetical protein